MSVGIIFHSPKHINLHNAHLPIHIHSLELLCSHVPFHFFLSYFISIVKRNELEVFCCFLMPSNLFILFTFLCSFSFATRLITAVAMASMKMHEFGENNMIWIFVMSVLVTRLLMNGVFGGL